jgi:glycerol kinase
MAKYAAAVDQGTTSTRFMIFDHSGQVVVSDQMEHEQIYPKAGWVEHDPMEIWARTQDVIKGGAEERQAAVGITNQRETTVVWDKATGKPVYNAIVWQDTRTDRLCNELAPTAGRTASAPRSASPGHLLLRPQDPLDPRQRRRRPERAPSGRAALRQHRHLGDLEPDRRPERRRARHRRDQRLPHHADEPGNPGPGTRRSRGSWASRAMLPEIRSSSAVYGNAGGMLPACRRRRSWATSRRPCSARPASSPGEAKNTYGTGCFMLLNTGTEPSNRRTAC